MDGSITSTIASVLLVLALSANTAFADFPRLTRAIALDDYMPRVFLLRGRRLLYSWGIYVLVVLTALLLIVFGGVTDRLIPLYAIGAFMAFTLSQAGMVMHWKRQGKRSVPHDREWLGRCGHGHHHAGGAAWPSSPRARGSRLLLILVMILFMRAVKRHYVRVNREIDLDRPIHSSRGQRAHRGGAHRSLEPDQRKGAFVRAVDVVRHSLRARADRATTPIRFAMRGTRDIVGAAARRPAGAFPS